MIKVLLQAGHQNITSGSTGAPEEQANNIRIRNRLGDILISKGFVVYLCDANFSSNDDFNLALSMHCDANYAGDAGGGFVDYPDPLYDDVNAESRRIKEAIESEYFDHSGIVNMPNRSNVNTKRYYWWRMLSSQTPCVIIEMGESIDPHDRVILADTDRVANAIARGICKAFNVPFDTPQPPQPPVDPCASVVAEKKKLEERLSTLERKVTELETEKTQRTDKLNKDKVIILQKIDETKQLVSNLV